MRVGFLVLVVLLLCSPTAEASYEAARAALDRKDTETALREAQKGADKGDPRAQRLLGQLHKYGHGVAKDEKEAARWFRMAAEQGDAGAQYELAVAFDEGKGVRKDEAEAGRWYRLAADQGLAIAQLVVGMHYMNGRKGAPKDPVEAAAWIRKAANQNLAEAQMLMAVFLFEGSGVQRDPVEAYMWISLAARSKAPKAAEVRRNLGKDLTPDQKKEAERLVKAWTPSGGPQQASAAAASSATRVKSSGTGFVVSADGHVITNEHVVRRCASLRVRSLDERVAEAKIVGTSRVDDLALLKTAIETDAVASFRTGKGLREGDAVVAFGFPLSGILASSGNLTIGNVTALAGLGNDTRFLQISTPIQPGNSGGPLLDMNGRIVGITTASISTLTAGRATGGAVPQNVNFAVKGDVAAGFLDKHGIAVAETGGTPRAMKAADVGARAKRFTVRVECLG